jgi:large subunit ribosomal protein L9
MPKTEIILTHNIVGLGGESDQVKVAAGYARNYLFPQGLAIPLTGANKRRIEVLKQRRAQREADELNHMTDLAKSLSKLIAVIAVKTGEDGKMFGAVTSGAIADQLKTQFEVTLDKRKIHLEHPIRALGEHEVELRLHQDVVTKLKVRVESTTPLPQPEAPPAGEEKREHRTEKRGRRPERTEYREPATAPAATAAATAERAKRPERKSAAPKPAKTEKAAKPEKAE